MLSLLIALERRHTECLACGHLMTGWYVIFNEGAILFTTVAGEMRFDTIIDPNASEISWRLQEVIQEAGIPERLRDRCYQKIYNRIVDPAPNGDRFYYRGEVPCPQCGSIGWRWLAPVEPSETRRFDEVEVVTFHAWSALSEAEQSAILTDLLPQIEDPWSKLTAEEKSRMRCGVLDGPSL